MHSLAESYRQLGRQEEALKLWEEVLIGPSQGARTGALGNAQDHGIAG